MGSSRLRELKRVSVGGMAGGVWKREAFPSFLHLRDDSITETTHRLVTVPGAEEIMQVGKPEEKTSIELAARQQSWSL
jgi:hypothetical protein